ncbi:MAG TPA: hypothetical protein VKB19_20310 [Pedobacter sp.]|nr:hypothetical protein [Pedobacter sp.]
MGNHNSSRRHFLSHVKGLTAITLAGSYLDSLALGNSKYSSKLKDVNTTDIAGAIKLGCVTMSHIFNADDHNIPFFGSTIGEQSDFWFNESHSEAHIPGRHLNALLNAEQVLGLKIDKDVIDKHTAAAFYAYSGKIPMPLNRKKIGGDPVNFLPHNIREGFHALYALVKFRNSKKARALAEQSIEFIFSNWSPQSGWKRAYLEKELGLSLIEWKGPFITGIARAIGPLVKYYQATGYGRALELAIILKEKALEEFFLPEGNFDNNLFGTHTHSTTCVMSSLAQLADVTGDAHLLARVKAFFDNGLKEISNEIGWSVENCDPDSDQDRGEINNTGDILETALIRAKWGYTEYYNIAERILRAHLLPAQLRDISFIKEPLNPKKEDAKRDVAKRHRGAFGFPAPYGHKPLGNTIISFNMDIVGGAVGSLCEAYRSIYSFNHAAHYVNLLFDYESESIRIESPYTHDALSVYITKPAPLFIRIPAFADRKKITLAGKEKYIFNGDYLLIVNPPVNSKIIIRFDLAETGISLKYGNRRIRAILRGDSVKAMENFNADLTFFEPI